ncbi:MAG: 50S ribosomal protein L4 [Candidatus Micrarchaeia archaeon]
MNLKTDVLSVDGKAVGSVSLPPVFSASIRPDLIRRAVLAEQTRALQPKGAFPLAGLQTTAEYKGRKEDYRSIKNRGISRLPREKLPKGRFGRVRIVPFSVKGRRAHPPKPEKKLVELINEKERRKAIASALAATASADAVRARGHEVNGLKLPIVVENKLEELAKTRDVETVLHTLGFSKDLARSAHSRRARGGRRGGHRERKSVLIIVGEDKGILRAARNIPGVDAVLAGELSARALAPGGLPGRLALYTESALAKLNELGG